MKFISYLIFNTPLKFLLILDFVATFIINKVYTNFYSQIFRKMRMKLNQQ